MQVCIAGVGLQAEVETAPGVGLQVEVETAPGRWMRVPCCMDSRKCVIEE